jgi:hypothetical protein
MVTRRTTATLAVDGIPLITTRLPDPLTLRV